MKIRKIKNTAEKLKNGGRTRQTDNRGLTLIELVITVAIIAIFSGVVMTFIMTGSNTYRSTSSNAKVQMETQELVDRMEDLIIDTNQMPLLCKWYRRKYRLRDQKRYQAERRRQQ